MKNLTILSFVICLAAFVTAESQTQKSPAAVSSPQRRIVVRPGAVTPRPPAQPAAGDTFRIDPVEKHIVIEREQAVGGFVQYRIPLNTDVVPEISSEFELAGEATRYSYVLANSRVAKQSIELFAVGTPRPDMITELQSPADFRSGEPSLAEWGTPPRLNFWSHYSMSLAPGRTTGPFRFVTTLLPGLVKAYVLGYPNREAVPSMKDMRLSLWLVGKLEEALKFENSTVQPVIVGPKFERPATGEAARFADAMRQECLEAAQLSEFGSEQLRLKWLAAQLADSTQSPQKLKAALQDAGSTPLQKSFYQAMALNLTVLGSVQ
jgi:hypothetical protein